MGFKIAVSLNALFFIGIAIAALGSFDPKTVGETLLAVVVGGLWLAAWCWELSSAWSGYGTPWERVYGPRGQR